MTANLRKRIADTSTLLEALKMLEHEPDVSGALKIKAAGVEGTVAFSRGQIIGASVGKSGERGEEALKKLAALGPGSVRYDKFHEIFPKGEQIDLTIGKFLNPAAAAAKAAVEVKQAAEAKQPMEAVVAAAQSEVDKKSDGSNGSEFHDSHPALSYQDKPPFTEYQQLRFQLAKEEESDNGKDFHESHPQLDENDHINQVAARHAELLESVAKDDKPFDHVDEHITWDVPSLSEEQRERLTHAAEEGRDLETFEKLTEFLQNEGLFLTPKQSFELQQLAKSRTKEEMVAEFQEKTGLSHADPVELRGIVEPLAPPAKPEEAPKGPTVTDEDRVPLNLLPDAVKPPKPRLKKGIIGRVATLANQRWVVRVNIPRRKQPTYFHFEISLGTLMGVAVLIGLAVGIFVVPDYIKHSGNLSTEESARQRLRKSIHEDLASDTPQESAEMKAHGMARHTANQGEFSHVANAGRTDLPVTEDLRFGRYLVTHARFEDSIEYYENYIHLVPENIQARIELINVYLATNDRKKARLLCIRTIKQSSSPADMAALWQLLSQCQTD